MLGYFRRPIETAEVIRDGWFLTGDIGKMDSDATSICSTEPKT
jgi:long-chain acyl-CoA synthetase